MIIIGLNAYHGDSSACIAGFLYENISEARDRRFNPMEGRLVDVGGHKMQAVFWRLRS